MNYTRIYEAIVDSSRHRKLSTHTETHHILPKSLGGKNNKNNLVELTPREHYVCHKLLVKMYPNHDKIAFAFWAMCNQKKHLNQNRDYIVTSRTYEHIKTIISKKMIGNGFNCGNTHKEDTKALMSKQATGEHHHGFKGYYITPYGKFSSSIEASKNIPISNVSLNKWCKKAKDLVLSDIRYYQNQDLFNYEDIGKTLAEIGYGFEKAERIVPKTKTTKIGSPSSKRYKYITPHGIFMSGKEMPSRKMIQWCKDNYKKLSNSAVTRMPNIVRREDVGKTFKELGYSRIMI